MPTKNFIGKEGFIWFIGVVEDRNDPEQLGRLRVRCFGWHTEDKTLIPTEALPWAQTCNMTNTLLQTPREGDYVLGFFLDAESAQIPVILGVLSGKPKARSDKTGFSDPSGVFPRRVNEPTINRLSRGRTDGTIIETRKRNTKKNVGGVKGKTWNEPESSFSPKYPHNNSWETDAGHAFELDDTPGAERVHLAHKNGSFIEFDSSGNQIEKITKDKYKIVLGDDFVSIDGSCNVTVNGNCNLKVGRSFNIEANEINMTSSGDIRMKSKGSFKIESSGSIDMKASSSIKIGSGAFLALRSTMTSIQGTPLTLSGLITNKVKCPKCIGIIIPEGSAPPPSNSGL